MDQAKPKMKEAGSTVGEHVFRDKKFYSRSNNQVPPTYTTLWKPTPEELELLNTGQCVAVNTVSYVPSISVEVEEEDDS